MESMGKKPRRRRSFTPEFKAEIVELCQRGRTPRGGSTGLIRAAWKSARWRASEQPPAPCQIRRSIGAEQAGQCPLRTLTAGNPRRFSVKIGLTVSDVGLGLVLP